MLLLRYGEIFLKGKNRTHFERKLVANIKKITGVASVTTLQSRLVTDYFPAHAALKSVFGLVSYSPAIFVENNVDTIKRKALEMLQAKLLRTKNSTFRVETKRSDKSFPIRSLELNSMVGKYLEANSVLRFSFEKPDHLLKIEISQEGAFLFFDVIPCHGGLPTGVEGKVLLLVGNEADLLAGLLFMKRGCSIYPVALTEKDISLLQAFSPAELKLHVVKDFKELEEFAGRKEISILATGQVLGEESKWKTNLTVMKPLVAYSKKQIPEQLKLYGSLL